MVELKHNSVVLIDGDVLTEIFEYLVKGKVSELGAFDIRSIFYDTHEDKWVARIFSEEKAKEHFSLEKYTYKENGESIPVTLRVSAELTGRDERTPADNFRQSRKIGKVMEEKLGEERKLNVKKKVIAKKKKIAFVSDFEKNFSAASAASDILSKGLKENRKPEKIIDFSLRDMHLYPYPYQESLMEKLKERMEKLKERAGKLFEKSLDDMDVPF